MLVELGAEGGLDATTVVATRRVVKSDRAWWNMASWFSKGGGERCGDRL